MNKIIYFCKPKLVIILNLIFFVSIVCPYGSFRELKEQSKGAIRKFVSDTLKLKNYEVTDDKIEVKFKPLSINVIVNTNKGKKFLKLHDQDNGKREYTGAKLLSRELSVVEPEELIINDSCELLVQPFVEQIDQKILFNVIENLNENKNSVDFMAVMFNNMLSVVVRNLGYTIHPALNDNLYINRLKTKEMDNESGRIENFYKNSRLNLADLEISWESLLKKRVSIDGVIYKETLCDLLQQARSSLNPKNRRLISICHGDWHEMNTYIANLADDSSNFCFLDCEYAGLNDVIGDVIVYLVYNSVLMAYLSPKYYPEQFKDMSGLDISQRNFIHAKREVKANIDNQMIYLNGVGSFGTSNTRKKITKLFINTYFDPLIKRSLYHFNLDLDEIEEKIKGCILLRLLGVYNISLMEPMDQAKILGLIFKTLATPVGSLHSIPTLTRFERAL